MIILWKDIDADIYIYQLIYQQNIILLINYVLKVQFKFLVLFEIES